MSQTLTPTATILDLAREAATPELDDWRPFGAWLANQPPDRVIGRSACADACPLHAYLTAQGAGYVRVHARTYIVRATATRGPIAERVLPEWALAFRREIDRPFRQWRVIGDQVRASECAAALLAVLERLGLR